MQFFALSNRFSLCLLTGAFAFAVLGCEQLEAFGLLQPKQEVAVDTEAAVERIEPATEMFVEPNDSKIDLKRARYFGQASEAIIFMGREWAEKMDSVDDDEKLKLAASYEKALDDLIRKFGIKGKEEFKWIQAKALPDPVNKEVFARAGIWVKQ